MCDRRPAVLFLSRRRFRISTSVKRSMVHKQPKMKSEIVDGLPAHSRSMHMYEWMHDKTRAGGVYGHEARPAEGRLSRDAGQQVVRWCAFNVQRKQQGKGSGGSRTVGLLHSACCPAGQEPATCCCRHAGALKPWRLLLTEPAKPWRQRCAGRMGPYCLSRPAVPCRETFTPAARPVPAAIGLLCPHALCPPGAKPRIWDIGHTRPQLGCDSAPGDARALPRPGFFTSPRCTALYSDVGLVQ